MKHAREDYNSLEDPKGLFGKDEPVFVIRAKDKTAPAALRAWAKLQTDNENPDERIPQVVLEWANVMEKWQEDNGCKLADLPK